MIGKIKGKLAEAEGNLSLIETSSGVFYQLFLPPALIAKIPPLSPIEVYTYLQVRDDALVLFGFESKDQKNLFQLLLTVSGVGPKTAFTVISFSKEIELIDAVKKNDIDFFQKVPGLGKKTAMKIILELSQKLKEEFKLDKMYLSEDDKIVIDALISLGFSPQEAKKTLPLIPKDLNLEQKITFALKKIKK